MNSTIFMGLDIGGSLTKIVVAAFSQLTDFSECLNTTVEINNSIYLYSLSFQKFQECLSCIAKIKGNLIVGVTGGGATKYNKQLKQAFPSNPLLTLSQYQCNVKGLEFIRKSKIKLAKTDFIKTQNNKIQIINALVTLDQVLLPIQLISLGTGVNYSKIGQGISGFQRLKVQDPKTSFDGYLLEGSCLGAGYIIGLVSMLSQQKQAQKIISLIKDNLEYQSICSQIITNLMKSAIQLSIIHATPTIIAAGSILKTISIQSEFNNGFCQCITSLPFKRSLLRLKSLEGFLGCLGILQVLMAENISS